jgi:flagellar hook-associated protein FlgK
VVAVSLKKAEARDLTANDIRDRRDQLVNELAQLVDVHIEEQGPGQSVVIVGGGAALIGRNPLQLRVATDDDGNPTVIHEGIDEPLQLGGGQLAGLLAARNELLPGLSESLSTFVTGLITSVDAAHAAGVGASGPFELLLGGRGVSDTTLPLSEATSFDLQSGELFINVTDQGTGDVTLQRITFDPATDSLQDLAAIISSVANIQAVVDTQTGSLQIIAQPGFAFDFTGSLPAHPDTGGITGTTLPQFHGRYNGAANQELFFEVVGSGTVGVDAGLTLEVRNATGDLIGVHDIGADYEPESPLNLGDGISVSLSSGSVNNGDTFNTTAVAQSDTTGILTALGLNTFFVGSSMSDIAVNPALLNNPDLLASSKSGELGDNLNLQAMLATRDASLDVLGNQTIEQYFAGLLGNIGQQIQDLTLVAGNLELLGQHLEAERAAISGVDTNEELVHMLEFQRWFQAASRYIATMDETLDELFRIIG